MITLLKWLARQALAFLAVDPIYPIQHGADR